MSEDQRDVAVDEQQLKDEEQKVKLYRLIALQQF